MSEVVTRKGIFKTLIKNHFFCALITFVLVLSAFKWLYSMEKGQDILFLIAAAVYYYCGVYSYTYYQAKVDMRDKHRYDFIMPLKIGCADTLIILIPAMVHILLVNIAPPAGELFGFVARFWNYSFFSWFYGAKGTDFYYLNMIIFALVPVAVAYGAYFLGIKRFSFLEKLNKLIYKK